MSGALPVSQWQAGYVPTATDFQHINDPVIAWAQGTFVTPGQLPDSWIQTVGIAAGVLLLAVPAQIQAVGGLMQVDLRGVTQAANSDLYMRISTDNAVSWLQDPTQYGGLLIPETGPLAVSSDHLPITGPNPVVAHPSWGTVLIDFTARAVRFSVASGPTQASGNGWWTTTATVTHVLIASVRSTLTAGAARLTQVNF